MTPFRDYPLEHRTIGRILADKAQRIPGKPFLLWQGRTYSYLEVETVTNRYANGFAALGIGHGTHVALLLPNCPEFLWVLWGLGKIGAVAVPVNTAAKGEMLRYFIDQSDSTCVVLDMEFAQRVEAIAGQLPKVTKLLVRGVECDRAWAGMRATQVHGLSELEAASASRPPPDAVRHDDLHCLMYTSGTTGPSKGAMSPHSQGHGVGRSQALGFGYRTDDVLYTCLPLFHANALWYTCHAALWAEACVALSPRFSASRFWDEIRSTGATQFNSLGAMTNIIWKLPRGPHEHDHSLRQCMTVPVPKDIYREMQERYHLTLTSVYAMTENFAMTLALPDDPPQKAGSSGKPRGDCQLRIVDDAGRDLAPGEVGEIWMRPAQAASVMKGYYKMPQETASQYTGEWFHTGDRGYLDADGFLFFVDRKKEAIRRRGENISAHEVETILCRHPAILEVAAVPVASEMSEDDVMVYVVRSAGQALSQADVVRFAAENMSYFMVPRYVEFVGQLPKTASEKVEKYKLKEDARARRELLWDREREGIEVRR